ncbi:hydrolase 76 protein [Dinochytrium kinnereticum]|nr:hydrolase 76 protein [Dinochytrium kinnereticum]
MKWMNTYYNPDGVGAWTDGIVQWHESALYWNTYVNYRKFSGDPTYDDFINGEMIMATRYDQGDFLDSASGKDATWNGRWNDDIGWWGLMAISAAEVWGPQAIVDPSGSNPANRTLEEMLEQNDQACGGGIYWSRNRNGGLESDRNYKSTISNTQAIELAARIYALKPEAYLQKVADEIYAWMRSGLITDEYEIYDGVHASTPTSTDIANCGLVNGLGWSYQYGPLISGMATWYTMTKDQKYLDEAHKLFDGLQKFFFDPTTGGVQTTERGCKLSKCKSPTGFTWPVLRALFSLYRVSPDVKRKEIIKKAVQVHATEVATACNSAEWNCIRKMPPGTSYITDDGMNPRDQIEIMESLISLSVILGATPKQDIQTGVVTTRTRSNQPTTTSTPSGANRVGGWALGLVPAAAVVVLAAV